MRVGYWGTHVGHARGDEWEGMDDRTLNWGNKILELWTGEGLVWRGNVEVCGNAHVGVQMWGNQNWGRESRGRRVRIGDWRGSNLLGTEAPYSRS